MVGRRIAVHADLDRVWVTCEGALVADHVRVWAWHQTITDFEHAVAAKQLRRGRGDLLRPVPDALIGEEVEIRSLSTYDHVLGLVENHAGIGPVDTRVDVEGEGLMAACTKTSTAAGLKTGRDVSSELEFLTRALKAPTLRESVTRLAERAREESWTHEEFLAACLQREAVETSAVPRAQNGEPGHGFRRGGLAG